MVIPGFWIGVAARAHVARGKAEGFVMFAHGTHAAVKRTQPGDWFAYYSPAETLDGKEPVRRFTAVGRIAPGEPEPSPIMGVEDTWMRRAEYLDAAEVDIYPLLDLFSFVTDRTHWGMYFRKSLFGVSQHDFTLIAEAAGVGAYITFGDQE